MLMEEVYAFGEIRERSIRSYLLSYQYYSKKSKFALWVCPKTILIVDSLRHILFVHLCDSLSFKILFRLKVLLDPHPTQSRPEPTPNSYTSYSLSHLHHLCLHYPWILIKKPFLPHTCTITLQFLSSILVNV